MIQVPTAPQGTFPGRNFMTPAVLAFYRGTLDGRTAYVELSGGRGIANEPIFGVTVRREGGARLDPDRSKVFWSQADAERYIANGCKEAA